MRFPNLNNFYVGKYRYDIMSAEPISRRLYTDKVGTLQAFREDLFKQYYQVQKHLNDQKKLGWVKKRKNYPPLISNVEIDIAELLTGWNMIKDSPTILVIYRHKVLGGLEREYPNAKFITDIIEQGASPNRDKFRAQLKNLSKNPNDTEGLFDIVISTLSCYNNHGIENDEANMRDYMFNMMATFARLHKGGSAIVRLSIPNTDNLTSLIIGLNQRFERVNIVHPNFGSPVSMRMYAVCRDYNKICPKSTWKGYLNRSQDIHLAPIYSDEDIQRRLTPEHKKMILKMIEDLTASINDILTKRK